MQFLDLAGVKQFKDYNDSRYVTTTNVGTVEEPTRDTYTKAEIDEMLADIEAGTITESDPVFTASAAYGISSSDITNWNSKTSNAGTITGITMNGSSKGTSGVVNLGTVLTEHQDITGKADKSDAIGSLSLSLNSTNYQITLSGTKVDGTTFTVSDTIDLPLESVVVNGSYNNSTKKVVLTLQNGNTVDFSVADLVAGLQSEITSTNKLSADLIQDGTTNKVVTATEKSTWNGKQDVISDLATIRSGAQAGATALQSYTETDPVFSASAAAGISSSDITNWNNKTSNTGTVTGVKMNGTTNNPTSGIVDLGTVLTSETSLSKGTTTGSGNVVTDLSVSGHTVTLTKGATVPVWSSANSGKIPMINSSGGWDYVTPSAIYSGSAAPDSSTGTDGDLYLQTS